MEISSRIGKLTGEGVTAMSALTYELADDDDGAWTIVFEPDDLHLYVDFVRSRTAADPANGMTIDDFLARRPQDQAHHRAVANLVALLCRTLGRGDPIPPAADHRAQSPP
ncbi:hypothetical protein [Mesorhizobium sp. M0019]|uniref:hypothetical protein n=1 Tax=Mesorhizobium sp. M0019 TaxID=2956845 RepID=UPI003336989A